jgi:hypothetical protein
MPTEAHNNQRPESNQGITIRRLGAADADAVRRLAGRDSVAVPPGELVGVEIEGRLLAMQPVAGGGRVIADPFVPTSEITALLELRTAQLRRRELWRPVRAHEPAPAFAAE